MKFNFIYLFKTLLIKEIKKNTIHQLFIYTAKYKTINGSILFLRRVRDKTIVDL